jgi:chemotaxis protein MotA
MAQPKNTPKPQEEKAAKPVRTPTRPDLATIAGIALALSGIIGGLILEKGKIQDIVQGTAAMIVLGGTIGAVLVTTPLPVFMRALKGLGSVFFGPVVSTTETIDAIVQFSSKARRNGIVSLETETHNIADPFLRKALSLAVDGTDLQELKKMMEIDIVTREQSAEAEAKVWEAAGGYAPTIGIIGAVMGLIQVMKHLEDIKEVGHGIAVAFVATVYGVGSANIFFLPAANKLRARMRDVTMLRELALEGVIGIVEGLNPTLIRLKLNGFDQNPAKPKKQKENEAAPAPAPSGVKGEAAQTAPAGD